MLTHCSTLDHRQIGLPAQTPAAPVPVTEYRRRPSRSGSAQALVIRRAGVRTIVDRRTVTLLDGDFAAATLDTGRVRRAAPLIAER